MLKKGLYDYRGLRFRSLKSPEYRHTLLLLFWPVYGLVFGTLERGVTMETYHMVHCALDDAIPFCEYFFIPYLIWFVYLTGSIVYTFFYDVPAFRRMMRFIILTYSATLLVYIIYPTAQELRPAVFPRDNFFCRFARWFYAFDTNTNVCPSLHVIGSIAAMYSLWNSRHFKAVPWRVVSGVTAVSICVSVLFVKQHSVLDVLWALPLCLAGFLFAEALDRRPPRRKVPS